MITLLFAGFVLAVLWWLVVRRRAAALAAFFLLFSLITRVFALVYVDLAGPVYAVELGDDVGGGGSSMPLFALSVLAFLLPLAWVFRPAALQAWRAAPRSSDQRRALATAVVWTLVVFLLALYGDMVTRGPIPIFAGIDRLEYNRVLAGPLHPLVFDFGFLFAVVLGIGLVHPRLRGGEFDFRFLALYGAFMLYFALTGNRFSAFYSFSSFALMPMAALPMANGLGMLPAAPHGRSAFARLLCSRAALALGVMALLLSLAALLINNLVTVREYEDPAEQFAQRSLIQPVQLWWTTWQSLGSASETSQGWQDAFINPIDPTRNTSIQVLMIKNLGDDRAAELLDNGQQYAGGYPEILFELFGPGLAMMAALLFGFITAFLLRLVVGSVLLGRFVTAFVAAYVFYGFSLLYIGGMLNFLIVWTFWVKCAALLALYLFGRWRSAPAQVLIAHQARPQNLPSP